MNDRFYDSDKGVVAARFDVDDSDEGDHVEDDCEYSGNYSSHDV